MGGHDLNLTFNTLSCADLFRVMVFAQSTWCESLGDIDVCPAANSAKLFHIFARANKPYQADAFFVTRAKRGMNARRIHSATTNLDTGVICDQTIAMNGLYAAKDNPEHLRRIRLKDPESGKSLIFLPNDTALPPLTIAALTGYRWQVELFFTWVTQHLRIERFLGMISRLCVTSVINSAP